MKQRWKAEWEKIFFLSYGSFLFLSIQKSVLKEMCYLWSELCLF